MDDQAHALMCKARTVKDLQRLATEGLHGKVPCSIKPLYVPDLTVKEIRDELKSRGVMDVTRTRKHLQKELQDILKGVQRVPSLLLLNPQQSLTDLNLQDYTILDCEPLHDIKGHLINLFEELPSILPPTVREECTARITKTLSKEKKSAADLRATLIHLYLMVSKKDVDWKITSLLQSILMVSEVLYSSDHERCPKLLLRLYVNAWFHHQLCYDMFQTAKSRENLFGLYLHSLSKHAPEHYELLCLKSINTENQERLFSKSRHIAEKASNRSPGNVITNILFRMQCNTRKSSNADTIVHKAAKSLPHFQGTQLPCEFVAKYNDSWQAQLQRLSPFLVHGKQTWWTTTTTNEYLFMDGDDDPKVSEKGPWLFHFRDSNMEQVVEHQEECWRKIVEAKLELPTATLKVYSPDGEFLLAYECTSTEDSSTHIPGGLCAAETEMPESGNSNLDAEETEIQQCSEATALNVTANKYLQTEKEDIEQQNKNESVCPENITEHRKSVIKHDELKIICTEVQSGTMETKLCISIAKCIGDTPEVKQLDILRKSLKIKQHNNEQLPKSSLHTYKELMGQVKIQIKLQKNTLQQAITELKKQYVSSRGCLPTDSQDSPPEWTDLLRRRNYAFQLLQLWNDKL